MEDILVGSLKHMWPYCFLPFVVGELLLLSREKKRLSLEKIAASIICLVLTVIGLFRAPSSWAFENRPVLLAVVNIFSIYNATCSVGDRKQLLLRVKSTILKHAALLGVVLVTMFILPLWALYVTCASGLGCL